MQKKQNAVSLLTRKLITDGKRLSMVIVSRSADGALVISEFDHETPNTVFVDSTLATLSKEFLEKAMKENIVDEEGLIRLSEGCRNTDLVLAEIDTSGASGIVPYTKYDI